MSQHLRKTKVGADSERMPAVLLLGVSKPGIDALERLELCYDVVGNSDDIAKLEQLGAKGVQHLYEADFTNPATLELLPLDLSRYDRTLSFTEHGLLPAAWCNSVAGATSGPRAAYLTRNKAAMRQRLTDAALSKVRFGFGPPLGRGHTASANGGLVISKPVDGSSSIGISLVAPSDFANIGPDAYWEQFVEGTEFSVEAVSCCGQHDILGVTRKFHTTDGRFIEVGHIFPARFDTDTQNQIADYVSLVLDALGVQSGASHTEVKLAAETGDLEVIETHTRPGGDAIPRLVQLVTGRDQYHEAIAAELVDACGWTYDAGEDRDDSAGAFSLSLFGLNGVQAKAVLDACGQPDDFQVVEEETLTAGGVGSFARNSRILATTSSSTAVDAAYDAFFRLYGAH